MPRPRAEVISEMVDSGLFSDDEIRSAAKGYSAQSAKVSQEPEAYQPTMLEKAADFLQPLTNAAERVQSSMPMVAGMIAPPLGMAQYAGSKINQASGQLGESVSEKLGEAGVNPYASAALGMGAAIASNPLSYLNPEIGLTTKLAPAKGAPSLNARLAERATGVKASSFERLRRDPGAFFSLASREKAGEAIGAAKIEAGVSPGVTNNITSLTKKNLEKARNVSSAGAKAENAIIQKIENALESGELPTVEPGATTGSPHALFAYTDQFGEAGPRNIYNVFGDKTNPTIQNVGYGSSVSKAKLDELGIPITGREPRSAKYQRISQELPMDQLTRAANITPDEISTALDGINKRLTRIERASGRGSPDFQKWAAIKDHFQGMLESVAPDIKQANKDFSRIALRDEFLHTNPVNQSGTMSKIDAFGFTPGAIGAGALVGGIPGAAAAYVAKRAIRAPIVRGAMTAARGLMDKVLDPPLSLGENALTHTGSPVGIATSSNKQELHAEFLRRFVRTRVNE